MSSETITSTQRPGQLPPVFVEGLDGPPIRVHDFGGSGPDLLLVHATGLHGAVWEPVARHLAGWHGRALDLRGHGDSPVPDGDDLRWPGFGRDVLAVVDDLARPVLGVGHSLGAVALLMAALEAPDRFTGLVLYEPAMRMETGELAPGLADLLTWTVTAARRRRRRFASRAEAMSSYALKQPFAVVQAAVLHAYVQHGFRDADDGVVLKCAPEVEAQVFAQSHEHDLVGRLPGLTCPVVVVRGAEATPEQVQSSDGLAAALSGEPVVMAGADHFGPLAQPSVFAGIVRAAAERIS